MTNFSAYLKSSITLLADMERSGDFAAIRQAVDVIFRALACDKPLLICGNGGSASDAMHIAGELVGRFLKERRALRAIALTADSAVLTAWSNDYSYDDVFARQVEAYGEADGVLLAISTSGNSKNVVAAAAVAKRKAMKTVALTGAGGGALAGMVDVLITVPSTATPLIQQAHICIYHYLCAEIEAQIV
jgi:D-sedoheptulose 7-phosphate isomerase